ncbi:arginyltransferase [Celerinatantimonas yamalensis]|uniref:Aspartate/glutamate leucyltransferase n=1 Tax=Celerinatantimonas yamalensis TaxID=559956 RepID=A0ABW9G2M6_9GAMM
MNHSFIAGVTPEHPCPYLSNQQAQELIAMLPEHSHDNTIPYQQLINLGFRRSGNDVYRPHCRNCQSCQSLRVDALQFLPTRSQKRILRKNSDLHYQWYDRITQEQYILYKKYLASRHNDGDMKDHNYDDYRDFIHSDWQPTRFLHAYLDHQLVAVAITDWLSEGLSAVYSFFDPTQEKRSLGTWLILKQLSYAKQLRKNWLYLGYQIDNCQKMKYKQHFRPHQRFIAEQWQAENNE